jgi:putative tryptophan/tyrosine transport system substrate-binding protein
MTRRPLRLLLTLALGCLVMPSVTAAQPSVGPISRIALVHPASPVADLTEDSGYPGMRGFFGELRRLGYVEGQNLVVERRSGDGQPARYPAVVAEVVGLHPDVIVVSSSRLARLFREATATIPILAVTADPIATQVVTNIARPGGNLTGVSVDPGEELEGKRLALLKETIPRLERVAFLALSAATGVQLLLDAAAQHGLTVRHVPMDGPFDEAHYADAFQAMAMEQVQAVLLPAQSEHHTHRRLIAALAAAHGLPAMYPRRAYVEVGGLMAYGVNDDDLWRQLAGYIDRVLKGAQPGELPYLQATALELVINLKTAETLGLTIPPSLLFQATEVIR